MKDNLEDIWEGLLRWRFWLVYGWQDINKAYFRTRIGGFVITLQTLLFASLLSIIFSSALGSHHYSYLAYLAAGYPLFMFVSRSINANDSIFNRNINIIKNIPFPLFGFVMRGVISNTFHLAFSLGLFLLLLVSGFVQINIVSLLAVPGLVLMFTICTVTTAFFGLFSLYFANSAAVIAAFTRMLFFATPVIWIAEDRSGALNMIAQFNPVYHLISIVREPMLGMKPATTSYYVALTWLLVLTPVCVVFMSHVRRYVVFKL